MPISRRSLLAALAGGAMPAATPPFRIIDPHVHVWKHDPAYPWAKETTHPPAGDATPERLLDLMRGSGVSHTVIIQYIGYRWDNRYALAAVRKYPKMFQAVARVNPVSAEAPDDLSRHVEEGFRGVRLSPAASAEGDWINGPLMRPLWRRCRELKVPMSVLTAASRLPGVEHLIAAEPELTVVIDHMADCPVDRPDLLQHLLGLARFPNVFVKVSHTWSLSQQPYPYRDTWVQVKRLYDTFGPRRLMWGTDWPLVEGHCGYAKALALVRDEMDFLNHDDREWMLGRTVERVWPFPA